MRMRIQPAGYSCSENSNIMSERERDTSGRASTSAGQGLFDFSFSSGAAGGDQSGHSVSDIWNVSTNSKITLFVDVH